MNVANGTSHTRKLKVPGKRVRQESNGEKVREITFCDIPKAPKVCVYSTISTKFYTQIPVGTAHHTVVNTSERRLDGLSNQERSGRNDACLHPRSSKIFVHQPISTKFYIRIRVGTAHSKVVKLPKRGVERRSNQAKSGKTLGFCHPEALKILFTNRLGPTFYKHSGRDSPPYGSQYTRKSGRTTE
jgi:hypothetical protein